MCRYFFGVFGMVALAGLLVACENKGGMAGTDMERTQLAAYAASTEYPGASSNVDNMNVGVLIQDNGDLRLINFSNQPINNANVWVNKQYVYRVPSVPAKGIVTLSRKLFYNPQGLDLTREKAPVGVVQVQMGNRLVDALGPASTNNAGGSD